MGRKENAGAGVTLIELVVALTLGAIIMMAIVAMYSSSTKMLFGSVKGYQNQVEASLAVENMARRLENAVWAGILDYNPNDWDDDGIADISDTNVSVVVGSGTCVAIEDGSGGAVRGLKDANDVYYYYFYQGNKLMGRHCNNAECNGCDTAYTSEEILANDIDRIKFSLPTSSEMDTHNIMRVEFKTGAGESQESWQITNINLRGRGSYGS